MSDIFKKRIGTYSDVVIGLFKDPKPVDSIRLHVIKGRAAPPVSFYDYQKWIAQWPVGERVIDLVYKRHGTVERVVGEFPFEDPKVYVRYDDGHVSAFGMRVVSIRPLNALEKLAEI